MKLNGKIEEKMWLVELNSFFREDGDEIVDVMTIVLFESDDPEQFLKHVADALCNREDTQKRFSSSYGKLYGTKNLNVYYYHQRDFGKYKLPKTIVKMGLASIEEEEKSEEGT